MDGHFVQWSDDNGLNTRLTAHEKPPEHIRAVYKTFQKLNKNATLTHESLIHTTRDVDHLSPFLESTQINALPDELQQVFQNFLYHDSSRPLRHAALPVCNPVAYRVTSLPGLFIYPSLLHPTVQTQLLERLLHRDLSNPEHKTNVHLHHTVPYPGSEDQDAVSFFHPNASDLIFRSKDSNVHKSITTHQFLTKKLRWMTLGGQYDWTNKVYPSGNPPAFPSDVKDLVERLFPMKAEAAIVNLYSPGDTLSLHRDVSEECNQPLVSISLGCDGIFVIGLDGAGEDGKPRVATIRLRSGDAVLMSGESRYAWHSVPKVLEGTCPAWMEDWPYSQSTEDDHTEVDGTFSGWRGWMKGKRINLNVRQMFDRVDVEDPHS